MVTNTQFNPKRTTEFCRLTSTAQQSSHVLTVYTCGPVEVRVTEWLAPKKTIINQNVFYYQKIASYISELWNTIEGFKETVVHCSLDSTMLSSMLLCSVPHLFLKQYDVLVGIEPNPGPHNEPVPEVIHVPFIPGHFHYDGMVYEDITTPANVIHAATFRKVGGVHNVVTAAYVTQPQIHRVYYSFRDILLEVFIIWFRLTMTLAQLPFFLYLQRNGYNHFVLATPFVFAIWFFYPLAVILSHMIVDSFLGQFVRLVGIEPNPGPGVHKFPLLPSINVPRPPQFNFVEVVEIESMSERHRAEFASSARGRQAPPLVFMRGDCLVFRVVHSDHSVQLMDELSRHLIDNNFTFTRSVIRGEYGEHVLSPVVSSAYLSRFDILVGVEPNPGPKKNPHARVPTFKRVVVNSQIREMKAEQRRITKDLDRRIKDKESLKKLFEPEGWFSMNVGLEPDSQEFIKMMSEKFRESSSNMKLEHSFNLGFAEWIKEIIDWLFTVPKYVYKFFLGIIDIICMALPKSLATSIRTILSIAGHDSSPTSGMSAEYSVPIDSIFAAMYTGELAKHIREGSWTSFTSSIKAIKASSLGVQSVFDFLIKILREVAIFLNEIFGLNLPILGDSTEVKEFSDRAGKLAAELRIKGSVDDAFADTCFKLKDEIERYVLAKGTRLEAHLKERLNYVLKGFQSIINQCERNYSPMRGTRVEPLGILIAGNTGAGKSTLTMPFLLALLGNVLDGEDLKGFEKSHNDVIFFRNTENEFFDGYTSKDVAIVYDDFGQRTDVAGSPNPDAFEIIRGVNTAPYHLHYSAIEDKSKHYARFKLLFATTNRFSLHFESIQNSQAVIRRFTIRVMQVPRIEFCVDGTALSFETRVLDISKVRAMFPVDFDKPETFAALGIVEFVEWDFHQGRAKANAMVYSFDSLLVLAIAKYKENSRKGDHMISFHNTMKTYVPGVGVKFEPEMADLTPDEVLKKYDDNLHDAETQVKYSNLRTQGFDPLSAAFIRVLDRLAVVHAKYSPASYDWCKEHFDGIMKFTIGLTSLVAGIQAFKVVYKWWFPGKEPHYGKGQSASNRRRARIRNVRAVRNNLGVESFVPGPANDLINSLFARNIYSFEVRGHSLGYVIFVKGTSFIMPLHFSDYVSDLDPLEDAREGEGERISFLNPNTGHTCFVLDWNTDIVSETMMSDKHDFVLLKVSESKIRKHKDIIKFFPEFMDDSFVRGENYTCSMSTFDHGSGRWRDHSFPLRINGDSTYELGDYSYSSRALEYNCNTSKGDCGLPLIVADTRLKKPMIMGFHTAGDRGSWGPNKNCVGVIVYQDELERFCKDTEGEFDEDIAVELVPECNAFEGFPVISSARKVPMPRASKIVRSSLSEYLPPPCTAPAVLAPVMRDGVLVDPMSKARKNYLHDEVFIDHSVIDFIYPYVANLLAKTTMPEPHPTRLYTFEEAVGGIDGLDYFDGIKRSTSAGYPFIFETGGKKGKQKWFGSEGPVDFNARECAQVRKRVEKIISNAKAGIRMKHIFVDYLKDETRPLAKVESVSTRQIMTCPMDYLIAIKMYFGDFMRHVLDNRILNGMAPGIDPFSEWGNLVAYLKSGHSTSDVFFVAGDYSKYDGKIPVPIARAVLRVIQDWYGYADADATRIRDVLFHEIHNSMHTADGIVYEFVGGNPSGQPLTTIFNSMANIMMMCYSTAADLKSRGDIQRWPRTFVGLRISVFGDDVILTNSTDEFGVWSQKALEVSILKYLGIVYTDDTKDGLDRGYRPISEITFLKRGFVYKGGVWHCPLDLGVLLDTLKWNKKDTSAAEMSERIKNVFVELSRHGKDVFTSQGGAIRHAALRCGFVLPEESDFKVALASVEGLDY